MANVARVVVKGWMPFDVGDNDEAIRWLGILNLPSHGLRIEYAGQGYGPENEHGGRTSYYRFTVSGEEAIWYSGVESLAKAFVEGGCVIDEAKMMDMEYDPDNMEWGDVKVEQPEPPEITEGSLMALIMSQRGE